MAIAQRSVRIKIHNMEDVKVFTFDWKEGVNELFDKLKEECQGKTCFFYQYDTQGDEFCFVVSPTELTQEQVDKAADAYFNQ